MIDPQESINHIEKRHQKDKRDDNLFWIAMIIGVIVILILLSTGLD